MSEEDEKVSVTALDEDALSLSPKSSASSVSLSPALSPDFSLADDACSVCSTAPALLSVGSSGASTAAPAERFVLHRRLAESLFGDVFLGTDLVTGRKVAVKMSTVSLLSKRQSRRGVFVFENPVNEAEALRAVTPHPHIVGLLAAQEYRDMHWLVQDFVGGGELFTHLDNATYFSDGLGRRLFTQLLSALAHIHSKHVCHLDVSLENILLDEAGTLKLCDFGLAQFFHKKSSMFDGSSFRPGKCAYMAPEIYQGLAFDGPKADIFSAGVVLFSLLVGQPPFETPCAATDNRYHLISLGATKQMIHALGLCERVSKEACDLMTSMMHPDPARRPSAAEALAHPWVRGRSRPFKCTHDESAPPSMVVEVSLPVPDRLGSAAPAAASSVSAQRD